MKSNYKRLGDYIRPIDVRNKDLQVTRLLGVSIEKRFIESIANTIGTDMSTYKIVKKGQFAYGPVTSRNGEKVSIALLEEDSCIISSSYSVFEIIDTELLLPEYLNLWFKRPEFDRYARFHSHGSAREIFDWEEMCNVELPIPEINEQRRIVNAYNTIERRIELKHKINENLEEQAQAIYCEMFVSKCVDGIPDEWGQQLLEDVADINAGGDRPQVFSDIKTSVCNIPIYSNGIEQDGLYGYTDKAKVFKESVTVSARGTVGFTCLRQIPYVPIVRLISVTPLSTKVTAKYLYFFLKNSMLTSSGTSQQQLTVPDFKKMQIVVPTKEYINHFSMRVEPIFACLNENKAEVLQLVVLENTLLTQMSSR